MSTEAACPEKQGRPSRPRPSAWPGLSTSTCGPTAWVPSVGGGWPFAGVHWEPHGRGWVVVGSFVVSSGIGIPFVILHFFTHGRHPGGLMYGATPLVFVPTGMSPASAGGPFQIGPPRFALTAPVSSVKLACSLGCGSGHPVVLLGSSPFGCLAKRYSFVFFSRPPPGFPYPSLPLSHASLLATHTALLMAGSSPGRFQLASMAWGWLAKGLSRNSVIGVGE